MRIIDSWESHDVSRFPTWNHWTNKSLCI